MIMRRIARPMLAAVFVSGGIETLRNPKPRIQAAEPVIDKLDKNADPVKQKLPVDIPTDAESMVKFDAAVKIGAGIALGLGKFPRLAAVLLAGSLVPTTVAAHRFWEHEDPQQRAQQQSHFFKNVALIGGLMIAAGDTHGKPSVAWRTKRAARSAAGSTAGVAGAMTGSAKSAADTAKSAADSVRSAAGSVTGGAKSAAGSFTGGVKSGVKAARH
ncbi:MAG TPA: DoxX family protein [Actinophytocola sp.]|uniref:DoxX family protein n=1 Tax=Actinophytocola sp. TaxID=1872138 RepID=UPI002F94D143